MSKLDEIRKRHAELEEWAERNPPGLMGRHTELREAHDDRGYLLDHISKLEARLDAVRAVAERKETEARLEEESAARAGSREAMSHYVNKAMALRAEARDIRAALADDPEAIAEALWCAFTVPDFHNDDIQHPCGHKAVCEVFATDGQWKPACERHSTGAGIPAERIRAIAEADCPTCDGEGVLPSVGFDDGIAAEPCTTCGGSGKFVTEARP